MVTPEEDKARIERARAKAHVVAQEEKERERRNKELWDKGIHPRTGEAIDPELKRMVEKDLEILRRRGDLPYAEGRGVIHVRSRKGGRGRKVRRG